jgi:hypothetical protein
LCQSEVIQENSFLTKKEYKKARRNKYRNIAFYNIQKL